MSCVSSRVQAGVLLLAIVAGMSGAAIAQSDSPPATSPANISTAGAPASTPENLRSLILQLSDRDPAIRAAAHEQLLGLSPEDLPALRSAIEQVRPLPPGDADALRDVVKHVFLLGQNSNSDSELGFMGITMADLPSLGTDEATRDADFLSGVVVTDRLPGFDAYRALRDGDIILSITAPRKLPQPVMGSDVQGVVRVLSAGQVVRFEVLRHGHRTEVAVTLSPRPHELPLGGPVEAIVSYRQDQEKKSEAFWQARFAAVVNDSIS